MVKGAVARGSFFLLQASAMMGGAQEVHGAGWVRDARYEMRGRCRVHHRYLVIYLFLELLHIFSHL